MGGRMSGWRYGMGIRTQLTHQLTQSRVTPYGTITEMASDVRGVLKSIILLTAQI